MVPVPSLVAAYHQTLDMLELLKISLCKPTRVSCRECGHFLIEPPHHCRHFVEIGWKLLAGDRRNDTLESFSTASGRQ